MTPANMTPKQFGDLARAYAKWENKAFIDDIEVFIDAK